MKLNQARPVVHFKKLPPLFLLSLGALAALLISVYVLKARETQKTHALMEGYVKALAEMSAASLGEAALSDDLVSMHAILQSLSEKDRVVYSAVHDLENKRLVQTGDTALSNEVLAYDAQIPLHDSLFGRVTVEIDTSFPGDQAVNVVIASITVLLMVALALALYESYGVAWYLQPIKRSEADGSVDEEMTADPVFAESSCDADFTEHDEEIDYAQEYEGETDTELEAEEDIASSAEPAAEPVECDLILVVNTVAELKKQLNGDRFEQLLAGLEDKIGNVLGLYGGELLNKVAEQGYFCVRFAGSQDQLGPFRAACAAHLIRELCSLEKFKLKVQAHICRAYDDVKIPLKAEGILFHAFDDSEALTQRVELIELEQGIWLAEGFRQPFQQLLADQKQSLLEEMSCQSALD